ncbi:hypothetical protein F511_21303 [Dorcoceras hygrometricum]|uniref:Uncharacterized protein n=1 Tax=Dorcoceras hygrometricum TaxID=472368 RepID=A0A2Z7BC69_9LAMI|nr:hypothetical protein F511_21303 [Dorcoceras hygrometricum]
MASSYISNAVQINFDSVLGIQDNDGMVNMFQALEATGLRVFLGCPSVLYEQELEQFFDTALIQDGVVTCAVSRKYVEIYVSRFAGVFNLTTDGLIDLSEVPNEKNSVLSFWRKDDMDKLKDILLMHIRDLEKQFSERFDQQDRANRKRISTQVAAVAVGLTVVQKDVHDTKDTFFHQLLDFRAQAQENYNNLTTQLDELVDYINRDGNDKKGEESSSRRPQPPPDDQNTPSGGSASRGGGGSSGSSRRDDRRDSSKRRSSSGGGGSSTGGETYGPYGPYKKNAEWWLYGKNQF